MLLHEEITDKIIKNFYTVYNKLGYGFLEKIYENALLLELRQAGLKCAKQVPIEVYYEGISVGNYFADILVEDKVILELKAGDGALIEEHELQLINYLKATDKEVGLLLFFGKKPIFKRKIFTNENK
jgi:GxxExxY protein